MIQVYLHSFATYTCQRFSMKKQPNDASPSFSYSSSSCLTVHTGPRVRCHLSPQCPWCPRTINADTNHTHTQNSYNESICTPTLFPPASLSHCDIEREHSAVTCGFVLLRFPHRCNFSTQLVVTMTFCIDSLKAFTDHQTQSTHHNCHNHHQHQSNYCFLSLFSSRSLITIILISREHSKGQ